MRANRHRAVFGSTIAVLLLCSIRPSVAATATEAPDFSKAAAIFATRCSGCHTVGEGTLVGPDLAGVTERHERVWLVPFIQSSQTVIQSGDESAVELFERFEQQKMPDHPLSPDEIDLVLAFIEAGGPAILRPTTRPAIEASAEDLRMGKELFLGLRPLDSGAPGCGSCHGLGGSGTLGGDLAAAMSKYGDAELARRLERSTLPSRSGFRHLPLTEEESFCLRALLLIVDRTGGAPPNLARAFPLIGVSGGLLLAGVSAFGSVKRRRR